MLYSEDVLSSIKFHESFSIVLGPRKCLQLNVLTCFIVKILGQNYRKLKKENEKYVFHIEKIVLMR